MKVAVLMRNNEPSAFFDSAEISVRAHDRHGWHTERVIAFPEFDTDSPAVLRSRITDLADTLKAINCDIIAGQDLSGIAYTVFDREGFKIFTIGALTDSVLDGIAADVNVGAEPLVIPKPTALGCVGEYEYDLAAVQTDNPDISSKMALQSWMAETPFTLLRLRCAHVPPWIARLGKYEITETRGAADVIAEIRPL